ncbi:hypothetical protein [Nonomuraea rhodomycinica]|uniref:Uncharacterized protein n=1 Tax=Nonomuraea rhodomycinica TaxID=1712872 RepID=A0A7Y6M9T3_9ACTN|nr:hypothetical protein [Nonomuraea rhodomycinica]NUW38734.1 hypothetical protein [Nonomuraea rhodomycinica]
MLLLILGVADGVPVEDAVSAWSAHLYGELGALHPFDLRGGRAVYRARPSAAGPGHVVGPAWHHVLHARGS